MSQALEAITLQAINNLQKEDVDGLFCAISPQRKRLYIFPTRHDYCGQLDITKMSDLIKEHDIKRVAFRGFSPIAQYLPHIRPRVTRMLYNRIINEIAGYLPDPHLKNQWYRLMDLNITDRSTTTIAPKVWIDYLAPELIEHIGSNVFLGEEAKLITHVGYPDGFEFGRIYIGDNVVVGGMAIIQPGVTINDGATIAIGSIVTKDVPKDAVVAGNPARVIADANDYLNKIREEHTGYKDRLR